MMMAAVEQKLAPESGRSTPIFTWSPVPQKRQFLCTKLKERDKNQQGDVDRNSNPKPKDLYPNCDVTVWLRSCEQEVLQPIAGRIRGEIPTWLKGSLVRNGPGSLKVGDMRYQHLFDSAALLHRFHISNGEVSYQCRFLQSEVFKRNFTANRIVVTGFGTASVPDPCQTIFQRVAALFNPSDSQSDNAMISVYPFGDEMFAFTETPTMHKIDPETLGTDERIEINRKVAIVSHTSHPHVMKDGTVYNLGMTISKSGPSYAIICFPPPNRNGNEENHMTDNVQIVKTIPARWKLRPAYMHTFGITENYYVIVEQPLSVSVPDVVVRRFRNQPMAGTLKWYSDKQTVIHLVGRFNDKHYRFYSEAFFYLHIINQYEKSGHVVLDICCYRDPAMLDCMYVENMEGMQQNPDYAKMFRGRPLRFVLPLNYSNNISKNPNENLNINEENLVTLPKTKAKAFLLTGGYVLVKPELLCNLGCETPRINYENYLGMEYRYFYAISSDVDAENPGTVIKVDTLTKTRLTWCNDNCYPSEPIFVPHPDGKSEDDGLVLCAMIWGRNQTHKVGLLILDAKTMQEKGRAEFVTPSPAPKCLHGWFRREN